MTKKMTRKTIRKTIKKMTRKMTRRMVTKKRRKTEMRRKKKRRKIKNQVRPLGKITMAAKKMSGKPLMETALLRLKTFTLPEATISCKTTKCCNSVISIPVFNSFNLETDKDFG